MRVALTPARDLPRGGPVDPRRVRALAGGPPGEGPVVYWMQRDQRADDNWALAHAVALADARRAPVAVAFAVAPAFAGAQPRHFAFLLAGLAETERRLRGLGIPLIVRPGHPPEVVLALAAELGAGALVTDFNPVRPATDWQAAVAAAAPCAVHQVDAHNIVPCWAASDRREWGARTLRPKLARALPTWLVEPPAARAPLAPWPGPLPATDWLALGEPSLVAAGGGYAWRPGTAAATAALNRFVAEGLAGYPDGRGDPNRDGQSDLSPYLHFGHLSAQRAAWAVARSGGPPDAVAAFLEQLIVRRELADNFCHHAPDYDRATAFPSWARATLRAHEADPRAHRYDEAALEAGETHDALWNAAQRQMVRTGKMHNVLRMYWAKQLLTWTATAEEALAVGIALNDRHELDGRDPNGYAGLAWAIGGVHDRPWPERPIFGTVRSMTASGARRKLDVAAFVARWAA